MKLELYYDDKVKINSYLDSIKNKAKNMYKKVTKKKKETYLSMNEFQKELQNNLEIKKFEKNKGYGKKPIRITYAHVLTTGCLLTPGTNFFIPYIFYKYNNTTLIEIDRDILDNLYNKITKINKK
jgi:hypothetical protein